MSTLVYNRKDEPAKFLKDQFANGACMLACGGPSLNEIDLAPLQQRGIFVAAVSQVAATHVRPQAWFSVDKCVTYHEAIWRDPHIMKFVARQQYKNDDLGRIPVRRDGAWTTGEMAYKFPNVWYYERGDDWDLNGFLDTPWAMWRTIEEVGPDRGKKSVMLPAVRLLHWMGFRAIYLIGCDFNMHPNRQYAFPSTKGHKACRSNMTSYECLNITFHRLRPVLEAKGMSIFNATPGSRLTAFDFVSYADAIRACRKGFPQEIDVSGLYH